MCGAIRGRARAGRPPGAGARVGSPGHDADADAAAEKHDPGFHAKKSHRATVDRVVILLVEDNEDDAALAIRAFHKHHPAREIFVAGDGVAALEYLFGKDGEAANDSARPLPKVVLLDLKLPRLDGFQVLERIRQDPRTRLLPVVMLTTSLEDEDVRKSYSLGANSYVRKPVSFSDFLTAAKQLDDYWLALNEPSPTL